MVNNMLKDKDIFDKKIKRGLTPLKIYKLF